jgi:hypothetical protein
MAETFKNCRLVCTTSNQAIYTAPGTSGGRERAVVFNIQVANVGVASRTVTVEWQDASAALASTRLVNTLTVPVGSAVNILGGKTVLEAADTIRALASANTDVEITVSLIEIT